MMNFPTEWKIIKFHGSSHHQPVTNLCFPIIRDHQSPQLLTPSSERLWRLPRWCHGAMAALAALAPDVMPEVADPYAKNWYPLRKVDLPIENGDFP